MGAAALAAYVRPALCVGRGRRERQRERERLDDMMREKLASCRRGKRESECESEREIDRLTERGDRERDSEKLRGCGVGLRKKCGERGTGNIGNFLRYHNRC